MATQGLGPTEYSHHEEGKGKEVGFLINNCEIQLKLDFSEKIQQSC